MKHTLTSASAIAGLFIFTSGATAGGAVAQSADPLTSASAYSLYVHPNDWDRTGYFPLGVLFPRDNDELVSYGFDFSEEAAGPMIDPGGNISMGWFVTRHDKPIPPPANRNTLGQFEASWSWHIMPIGDDIPGYGKFTQSRSWYDPIVQKFMLDSDAALARIYGASPRPVMMWSLDNEWEGSLEYTPEAQAGFRTWLKCVYGTLAAVNKSWGTSYSDWPDVAAPKSEDKISNPAAWLDWHSFQDSSYTRFTANRYRAIYQADPLHRGIAQKTTQQSFDLQSVGKDRVLDPAMLCDLTRPYGGWYGVDIYDADDSYIYQVNFAAQCIRPVAGSDIGHLFLTETNNHGGPGWQFANSMWRSLGNGTKAYDFFCFGMPGATGDSDVYGLTSPNTLLRDKAPYAARFAYDVRRTEKFWARSKPAAGVHRVAILLNRQDMLLDDNIPGNIWAGPLDSRESVYAALRQAGYWVDAIPYTKLDAAYLKQYDALVLVNSDHLNAGERTQIGQYVKSGGVLLADTQAGYYDEHHQVVHGLDAVLGVAVNASSAGLAAGGAAHVVSTHSYGRGASIYSAVGLGTLHGDSDANVRDWLAKTLSGARVLPSYHVIGGDTSSLRVEQPFIDGRNIAVVIANVAKEGHGPATIRMQLPAGSWTHAVWSPAENEGLIHVNSERLPNGQYQYDLPAIATAGTLLLFDDHAPLISVHDIDTAKRGVDGYLPVLTPGVSTRVAVSVYNPSPASVAPGMLTVRALSGWKISAVKIHTGEIAPYGSYEASFLVTPPNSGVLPYAERMYPVNLHWSDGKIDRAVTTTPVGVDIAQSKCPWLLTGNAMYIADFPRKIETHATYRYLVEGASKAQVSDPASGKDAVDTALRDGYSRWLVSDESAHASGLGSAALPILYDLKDVYPLHEVRLQSSDFGGYPTKMDVSVSDDGVTFKPAGSAVPEGGPGSGKWLDLTGLEGKSARYVRLDVALQGGTGYIDEVEIWGYPKSK